MTNGGALKSPEDKRDWNITRCMDIPTGGAKLPVTFTCDIPETVRDQGAVNSCTAHAMATILSCIAHKLYGKHLSFSAGFLYGNRRETEYKGSGEIMRDVPKKAAKWGDVPETVWENTSEAPEIITAFEKAYPEVGAFSKKLIAGYVRLYDKNEAKAFMVRYGIPLFVSMRMNKISPFLGDGYHAMVCYKYGTTCFSCVNSWGEQDIPYVNGKKFDDFEEVWGLIPNEETKFTDLPDTHWAKEAICDAVQNGEMQGFPDGTFHPDEPITRAQMAVILQRMRQIKDGEKA